MNVKIKNPVIDAIVVVCVLISAGVIIWLLFFDKPDEEQIVPAPIDVLQAKYDSPYSSGMPAVKKKEILSERIDEASTKPLSEEEKMDILNNFGGNNTAQYDFTSQELWEIVDAINGKSR